MLRIFLRTRYQKFPHSFLVKSILAKIAANTNAPFNVINAIASASVSNMYVVRKFTRYSNIRDDINNTVGISYRRMEWYGYVLLQNADARTEAAIVRSLLGGKSMMSEVVKIDIIRKPITGRPPHNQTLLINKPSQLYSDSCKEGEILVHHFSENGVVAACQPLTWTRRPAKLYSVKTVFGTIVDNPPFPFPPPQINKYSKYTRW